MFGAGLATAKPAHFEIDFLKAHMPRPLKTLSSVFVYLVTLVFTLGVVRFIPPLVTIPRSRRG